MRTRGRRAARGRERVGRKGVEAEAKGGCGKVKRMAERVGNGYRELSSETRYKENNGRKGERWRHGVG